MNWLVFALVIFLTAMAVIGGPAWWIGRGTKKLDRTTLHARLEEGVGRTELPRAGYLPVIADSYPVPCYEQTGQPYGPFPVDTGPLLILSDQKAAEVELDRWTQARISETDWLIGEAEAKIPPRWR